MSGNLPISNRCPSRDWSIECGLKRSPPRCALEWKIPLDSEQEGRRNRRHLEFYQSPKFFEPEKPQRRCNYTPITIRKGGPCHKINFAYLTQALAVFLRPYEAFFFSDSGPASRGFLIHLQQSSTAQNVRLVREKLPRFETSERSMGEWYPACYCCSLIWPELQLWSWLGSSCQTQIPIRSVYPL